MSRDVFVYLYDLSKGISNQFSLQFLGKHIEGIWHSGIIVFKKEIFYGSNGIDFTIPEGTILGSPDKKIYLGSTSKTEDELFIYISELSSNRFHGSKYELLYHNCNTFSNELALWLTDKSIPDYVVNLPIDVLSSPLGSFIQPFLEKYSSVASNTYAKATSLYKNVIQPKSHFTPVFFEEPINQRSDEHSSESQSASNFNLHKSMIGLINSNSDPLSIYQKEMFQRENNADIKLIYFDALRYSVLSNETVLLDLCGSFQIFFEIIEQESENIEIENMKCKLVCNIIGKVPNDKIDSNTLLLFKNYALQLLNKRRSYDLISSSLIRNIVVHLSKLDFESCMEIGSRLIYLVCENSHFSEDKSEENVIGSIYYLVKEYQEIKDLAISYEIVHSLTEGTSFYQALLEELK